MAHFLQKMSLIVNKRVFSAATLIAVTSNQDSHDRTVQHIDGIYSISRLRIKLIY